MEEVVKNAKWIYDMRDYIIEVFWKSETEKLKQLEDKLNLDYLLYAGAEKLRQLK